MNFIVACQSMKNMISITLFFSLLALLTGCGGGNSASSASSSHSDTTTSTSTNTGGGETSDVDVDIRFPYPQHVTYQQASAVTAFTQAEMDTHVSEFYDIWKRDYLVEVGIDNSGGSLYRVAFGRQGSSDRDVTVSEGQGYGMLITVMMAGYNPQARDQFDGLWRFSKFHRSEIDNALMAWRVSNQPQKDDNNSAFDGDADIAYALLLAHRQWGSKGDINYLEQAGTLIRAISSSTIGIDSHLPLLGDWHNNTTGSYDDFSNRTSDFMLANFRAYYAETQDPVWMSVIQASQDTLLNLQSEYGASTGLVSDFVERSPTTTTHAPAQPYFLEGPYDGAYSYNACRVPWRIGLDALLSGNEKSVRIVKKLSEWMADSTGGNPYAINAGYYLDGNSIGGSYFSTVFVAPLGVAAMTVPGQTDWLNAIYSAIYNVHQGYYEDSVNLLSMLVMSRNFWGY